MDRIALKVATRYARRTLQFDLPKVRQLGFEIGEKAIERVHKALWATTPIGQGLSPRETIYREDLRLKNVLGKDVDIRIQVKHRRGKGNLTAGGHADRQGNITLYFNSEATPELLVENTLKVAQTFSSFLVHEVTHVLDVIKMDGYEGAEGDPNVYYNQPSEFRAFAKQILVEAVIRAKGAARMRKLRRKDPLPSAKLIEEALQGSETYKKVEPYWNARNQKHIRQILVTEFQQGGLI